METHITLARGNNWRISGDQVNQATSKLPDEQRAMLRWLDRHCRAQDLTLDDIADKLKKPDRSTYSKDSVYQALTGRRDSNLAGFCTAIAHYRQYVEREESTVKAGFVVTTLTEKIWKSCEKALARHRVSFIFGESQIGKTRALEEYARTHNHGETILVRMPAGGALSYFLEELALAMGVSPQQKVRDLRRRLINGFDNRMLLIVDECHAGWRARGSTGALSALEFIREIHDRTKCGLVLSGTNIFRNEVQRDGVLKQLWLRKLAPLQLPDTPAKEQLDRFAAAFGLPPAPDELVPVTAKGEDGRDVRHKDNPLTLQTTNVKTHGLGRWISILEEAADMAKEGKRAITWGHVIAAHALFRAMESVND